MYEKMQLMGKPSNVSQKACEQNDRRSDFSSGNSSDGPQVVFSTASDQGVNQRPMVLLLLLRLWLQTKIWMADIDCLF